MPGTPTCPVCKKSDKVKSIDNLKPSRHFKCTRCDVPISKAGPR